MSMFIAFYFNLHGDFGPKLQIIGLPFHLSESQLHSISCYATDCYFLVIQQLELTTFSAYDTDVCLRLAYEPRKRRLPSR